MKHEKIKKLSILAMLCALAYVVVVVARIPVIMFLKYEPKDVIITFGGFLYGPVAALLISAVVSFLEMIVMNVLSTAAFACVASLIYKKKHTLSGAVLGLLAGTASMILVMIAWNYLLTPLYMGTPRADIATMLLPVFLPFNALKGTLNSALVLLFYRPLITGLRAANLFPRSEVIQKPKTSSKIILWIVAALLVAACILAILHYNGIL